MARKQSVALASARAYYRLAVKAERNGQYKTAKHYRGIADRLVARNQRNREYLNRSK